MKHVTKVFGSRILKTGLAVFITALICNVLNLPSIFAVVTAIVTIEPTVSDSIRKGIVRLPASAIGAGISMTCAAILGDVPLTYTISTICTIFLCHKLKLDAGILVATLTAVTMIPFTPDHFLYAFFARLGTTTIGLFVSTMVNLLILPPDYSKKITDNIKNGFQECASLLSTHSSALVKGMVSFEELNHQLDIIEQQIKDTLQLCNYKREEWKYHRCTKKEERLYLYEFTHLKALKKIHNHLQNLFSVANDRGYWNEKDEVKIITAIKVLSSIIRTPYNNEAKSHPMLVQEIEKLFFEEKSHSPQHQSDFPSSRLTPETIILYEVLAINEIVTELNKVTIHTNSIEHERKLQSM
ncbi:FUSC family protein [Bacillus sp. PS06]|uniref:FUSC family protein n=1 Tax=Bacillus sp. PS06 TaxID=2764176 RepID=UPI001785AC74|nr:aromatic acid exporter family protein [Bacillus sp. PS06]MBD8068512.1 aromatic acid exporter family protein [Bacillus sp. PS06]